MSPPVRRIFLFIPQSFCLRRFLTFYHQVSPKVHHIHQVFRQIFMFIICRGNCKCHLLYQSHIFSYKSTFSTEISIDIDLKKTNSKVLNLHFPSFLPKFLLLLLSPPSLFFSFTSLFSFHIFYSFHRPTVTPLSPKSCQSH